MSFEEGSKSFELEIPKWRGEGTLTWNVTFSYHKSGMEPRPSDDVDQLYEYDITAYTDQERKLPLQVKPRLGWDECPERRPRSVPNDLGEAVCVHLNNAVNLELDQIRYLVPLLLEGIALALGKSWDPEYFTGSVHSYSTITQHERYVRPSLQEAEKITRSDGVFMSLYQLLADHEGSKVVYSADNRKVIGWNHQLRLTESAVREAFDPGDGSGTAVGTQLKLYRPEHPEGHAEDDPLAHPKLGALFKKGLSGDQAVPWDRRHELVNTLDTYALNIASWAGIAVSPGSWWVSDWHFSGDRFTDERRQVTLVDDPTPEIERRQESTIVNLFRELDPDSAAEEIVEQAAMTDGGTSVDELAAETEWSRSTIYRHLKKLEEILDLDQGKISFISGKIRDEIRDVLDVMNRSVDAATAALQRIAGMDARDLDRKGKAWQKWVNRYAAELEETGRGEQLRLRTVLCKIKSGVAEWAPEIVEYGWIAWRDSGRDLDRFPDRVAYETPTGELVVRRAEDMIQEARARR
jgi:AcrR family transcriptional regulator